MNTTVSLVNQMLSQTSEIVTKSGLGGFDIAVFIAFIAAVLFVGMYKSKGEKIDGEAGADEYFLAGRGLKWWLIGFSLIAANISAEQFVGMSGQGAGPFGISCASWEWIAAITLVVVAFALLPYFLKTGITTIPEFLEVRYNHWARTLMTVSMMAILFIASLVGVIYAGSLVMRELLVGFGYQIPMSACCWIMGLIAAAYVIFGGLKACAWADLLQGSALIIGGAIITYFAFDKLSSAPVAELQGMSQVVIDQGAGAIEKFKLLNAEKLIMGRPATDSDMPWTILLLGIWIPNFYYWGLNQYITQRILGSASLAEGQKGLVLAAGLKLIIPFIIVIPGIIAFNLFSGDMASNANIDFDKKVKTVIVDKNYTTYVIPSQQWIAVNKEEYQKVVAHNAVIEAKITPEIAKLSTEDKKDIKGKELTDVQLLTKVHLANKGKILQGSAYKYDSALGLMISKIIPQNKGVLGFVMAALLGAIISSLAAVLNAISTLFSMDVYQAYIKPKASAKELVTVGRISIAILVVAGCILASILKTDSIFSYIQEVQGFISPGILAVFVFGLLNRRASRSVGVLGLIVSPFIYGTFFLLKNNQIWYKLFNLESLHFLHNMSITLITTLVIMTVYGLFCKMPEPVVFESKTKMDLSFSKGALVCGIVVSVATIALYVIFW